jgi:hypothetical protein
MTRTEVIKWAIDHGWKVDDQGNLKKRGRLQGTNTGATFRLNLQNRKLVVKEVKVWKKFWVEIGEGLYTDLDIDKNTIIGFHSPTH